ncbi:MAG: hypothetical protein AB7I19_11060 [Planctomycetota bacterium]
MTYAAYKILHFLGLALILLAVGSQLGRRQDGARTWRPAAWLHGVGAVFMLVAGFGLMARTGIQHGSPWPTWLWMKFGVWGVLAFAPVVLRRSSHKAAILGIVAIAALLVAAWSALYKPFLG